MTDELDRHEAALLRHIDNCTTWTDYDANRICRRKGVQQSTMNALLDDALDLLHANYDGLHATTDQMRELTRCVPQRSWDATENAPLCFVAKYYLEIVQILDGTPVIDQSFLHSVVRCEVAKRQRGETPNPADVAEAKRLYYTYAVLFVGTATNATKDDLLTWTPPDGMDEDKRLFVVDSALKFQKQRRDIVAQKAKRHKDTTTTPKATQKTTPQTPTLFDGDKTISTYQTITAILAGNTMTADAKQEFLPLQPLRIQIEGQHNAAQALLADPDAADEDKTRAQQLMTTTTAVYGVLDALPMILQELQPDGSGLDYTRYDMTPTQFAQFCTGRTNPNSRQIYDYLRGALWLSTQRMQVFEKGYKTKTYRDEEGKTKTKTIERDICTNFQPLIVELRSEFEDHALVEEATRIRVQIHDIVKNGRSGNVYIDKSSGRQERLYIKPPTRHFMTIGQYYELANSDEERIFRSVLQSKNHIAEDALLAAVFDYKARQELYDKEAAAAKQKADDLEANPEATANQKQNARDDARKKQERAKYYITNHMGGDVDRLKQMFAKAYECGLIACYSRDEAKTARSSKKYGRGYVWKWKMTDAQTPSTTDGKRHKN